MAKTAKNVTVYGRLSYPKWTAEEAMEFSKRGKFPITDISKAQPSFQLLLTQAQYDRIKSHIETKFFQYVAAQHKNGEKKDAMKPDDLKKLVAELESDFTAQAFNSPFKPVDEKTAKIAPEAVIVLKVLGNKGEDIKQKAIVNKEEDLKIPDPDLLSYPVVRPIEDTVFSMYPGCEVAVTVDLYTYYNGGRPGFSAGSSVGTFRRDAERIGGSIEIDLDEIFLD